MKLLLYTFFIISVLVLSSVNASAQKKPSLPNGLNQDSSVSEILAWLDQTTFRNARIVLKDSWDDDFYSPPWDDTRPAVNTFIFTQGFRATNIEGCNLMLRNDDVRKVRKSKVEDTVHPLIVDVWVQLNRMSWDKGRRTHRFTNDPQTMSLLGAWRTEFRYYGWFSRTIVGLTLNSPEWKEPQHWEGMNIAFTFDSKDMSEKFDAAFRRAIKLCRSK